MATFYYISTIKMVFLWDKIALEAPFSVRFIIIVPKTGIFFKMGLILAEKFQAFKCILEVNSTKYFTLNTLPTNYIKLTNISNWFVIFIIVPTKNLQKRFCLSKIAQLDWF